MPYFQRTDQVAGQKNYYRRWLLDNSKGVLVIAHGLAEHSGRYEKFAAGINQAGYSVYALDHRGHGKSDGQQGHIDNFEDVASDLNYFIELVRSENTDKEIYLLGHSMGGLIATAYAMRYGRTDGQENGLVDGLIVSAPGYKALGFWANLQLRVANFLGRLAPHVAIKIMFNPRILCHDPQVVQAYINDPLVNKRVTLGFGRAFFQEQEKVKKGYRTINMPSLMLLAGSDKLVDTPVAKQWFSGFVAMKKQLEFYPDAFHEILNEKVEGKDALQKIIDWLDSFDKSS